MKLVKKQNKKTYIGKDGKQRHYYNYFLVVNVNDKELHILIKAVDKEGSTTNFKMLDMVSTYEK